MTFRNQPARLEAKLRPAAAACLASAATLGVLAGGCVQRHSARADFLHDRSLHVAGKADTSVQIVRAVEAPPSAFNPRSIVAMDLSLPTQATAGPAIAAVPSGD